MKKFLSSFLCLLLLTSPVQAAWDKSKPAGISNASDIDTNVIANNTALETLVSAPYGWKNLKVVRSSATVVTVTADQLYLQSTSMLGVRETSVNEALTITSSGASGLDTGVEATGTWYYVFIIRKSTDGTVNGLLSVSSTSPTMPTDYDQKALVSAVRNDGSGDFINFVQENDEYWYPTFQSISSGTVTRWTSLSMSTYVPSALSTVPYIQIFSTTNQNAALTNDNTVSTDSGNLDRNIVANAGNGGNSALIAIRMTTADTLYWGSTNGTVYCAGFRINKINS